jgi:hypothetical protein
LAHLVKLFAAMLLAGVAGGVVYDPTPPRPENHRAGYRVLEGDFHVHTTLSDGSLTPLGVARQAERRGLDVIALTEHNSALPGGVARGWSRWRAGPIVLRGEEVTSSKFHLIAVGIEDTVSPNQPLKDVIADIHRQHGVAIAAHPVKRYWAQYEPVRGDLDGSEVMHPLAYSGAFAGWRWEDLRAFYEETPGLMAIGSSDYHWGTHLGLCRTYVFVTEPATEESVMEALRARRTVVMDREGRYYGAQPALVEAMEKEPIAPRTVDYRYAGEGLGDRILRVIGFVGLLGLVLVGRVSLRPFWSSPKRSAERSSSSG